MTRARVWLLLLMGCLSCGDGGGTSMTADPALPPPGDPARGRAGNVLITDGPLDIDGVHDEIWIGFNRQRWADFLAFRERSLEDGSGGRIGGHLVADPNHHLGFYFDPDTTSAAENSAETNQTAIDLLKRDPAQAEQLQSGGWLVPAIIVRIVPGGD